MTVAADRPEQRLKEELPGKGLKANQRRLPGLPSCCHGLDFVAKTQRPAAPHPCTLLLAPLGEGLSASLELTELDGQTPVISGRSVNIFQVLFSLEGKCSQESTQAEKRTPTFFSPSVPERATRGKEESRA